MIGKDTRILIADDSQVVRKNTLLYLKNLGFSELREAWDGESALLKIFDAFEEGKPFGLIFCDMTMPRMSGKDVLTRLRRDDRFQQLPFVFITALGKEDDIKKAMDYGANKCLIKPYTENQIATLLEEI